MALLPAKSPDEGSIDAALVEALRRAVGRGAGEPDVLEPALEARLAEHPERIGWLCRRLVADPEIAAELAQETMLIACQHIGEFRGESSLYTWLPTLARRLCLHAHGRRGEVGDERELFEPGDPTLGVLATMRVQERDELLRAASEATLDPVEQEALYMRYTLGMGYDDITGPLGLTDASGARGLLQRCKRKLRRELESRLVELGHGRSLMFGSIGTDG